MEFCRYEKRGHVAYVTITRPEVMNALHAHASRELGGVWDDFAADDDLWVGAADPRAAPGPLDAVGRLWRADVALRSL
jgi:hypothetical protein